MRIISKFTKIPLIKIKGIFIFVINIVDLKKFKC